MSKLTVILVATDENHQLDSIANNIEEHCKHTAVMAIANNIAEGEKLIKKHKPRLVILELRTGEYAGLELLQHLTPLSFQVIVVGNCKQLDFHTLAFLPINYLLYPIQIDKLKVALKDTRIRIHSKDINDRLTRIENTLVHHRKQRRIGFTGNGVKNYQSVDNIIYLEAVNNNCRFFMVNGDIKLETKSMKHYEDNFSKKQFIKVSRFNIVNKYQIKTVHYLSPIKIEMENGKIIEVSRDSKKDFLLEMDKN